MTLAAGLYNRHGIARYAWQRICNGLALCEAMICYIEGGVLNDCADFCTNRLSRCVLVLSGRARDATGTRAGGRHRAVVSKNKARENGGDSTEVCGE